MELGSHLGSKLEPFLLISKSAKGAAAAKLVLDAISSQGVYFFAELLDTPNIKEVRRRNSPYAYPNRLIWPFQLASSEQHRAHYALLEIFTYKTYQDYLRTVPSRPRYTMPNDPLSSTKGGIARAHTSTNDKTQAPFSP